MINMAEADWMQKERKAKYCKEIIGWLERLHAINNNINYL